MFQLNDEIGMCFCHGDADKERIWHEEHSVRGDELAEAGVLVERHSNLEFCEFSADINIDIVKRCTSRIGC